ncbi:hypothetical protein L0222_19530 [bacterium]|nr:hypothetical protein [bacterium]MCI0603877.1 hypothetical protein [bacterium]
MLTPKFRELFEEYHRKKWFPEKYPDPFGEFIDYISEGMVTDLITAWEREKRGAYLDVARAILQLLPEFQFREIWNDYRKSLSEKLSGDVLPEFAFFFIRNSSEERSLELWNEFQKWNDKWEPILSDWARSMIEFEAAHSDFQKAYAQRMQIQEQEESHLQATRELFTWQFRSKTPAKDYLELLRYLQLENWKTVADWSDLPALAKSISSDCGIAKTPVLQRAETAAIQFLFPIQPPWRLVLEYGSASGPLDAMRFLVEFGKGSFYAGMNPELPVEERICGDPSLPWFWGYLFASLLADAAAVKKFLGLKAEAIAEDTNFVMECWFRHDVALSIYRNRALTDWKNVQSHYTNLWDLAYPVEPPLFLAAYELCHSTESVYRCNALRHSQNVRKHLQSKYGYEWFRNRKWTDRARDYWWEGFRLTTSDVLRDLHIEESSW